MYINAARVKNKNILKAFLWSLKTRLVSLAAVACQFYKAFTSSDEALKRHFSPALQDVAYKNFARIISQRCVPAHNFPPPPPLLQLYRCSTYTLLSTTSLSRAATRFLESSRFYCSSRQKQTSSATRKTTESKLRRLNQNMKQVEPPPKKPADLTADTACRA